MPRATPVVEPQGESKVLHEVAALMSSSSRSASRPARTSCRSRIFELAGPVHFRVQREGRPLVASVEKMLEDARQLDYRASTDVSAWATSPRRCAENSQ
jgi:hypothetical protein